MDNFDLKKFLKESKAIENLNPSIKSLNENYYKDAEADDAEHIDALEKDMKDDKKASLKAKIKEIIIAELEEKDKIKEETDTDLMDPVEENGGEDYELEDRKVKYGINPEIEDKDYSDYFFDIDTPEEDLEEAKKKKDEEVEDVEVTDTTEEVPVEDTPTEDPTTDSGLEDIAANMEGAESELMKNLMDALKIAKGMGNEKLETQVGNTLKFFVSEYIGGEEQ
jgi:hypothetical protein